MDTTDGRSSGANKLACHWSHRVKLDYRDAIAVLCGSRHLRLPDATHASTQRNCRCDTATPQEDPAPRESRVASSRRDGRLRTVLVPDVLVHTSPTAFLVWRYFHAPAFSYAPSYRRCS
jgi:hypothetical protein